MRFRPFLSFITIFFLSLFSIGYLFTANAAMNQGGSYLDLKPLKEKDINPILLASPTPEAKNDVKTIFTKSSEGTNAFKFSMSNLLIDFGLLSPTNPIIRESVFTIKNNSSHSFSIFAYQNHSLLDTSGSFIPDTSCDNGACTHKLSSAWDNTLTFGFGYSCENIKIASCLLDFHDSRYFKQFSNLIDKEQPEPVIQGLKSGEELESKIIYKVNISSTQPQLKYSNNINYVLVPGY